MHKDFLFTQSNFKCQKNLCNKFSIKAQFVGLKHLIFFILREIKQREGEKNKAFV